MTDDEIYIPEIAQAMADDLARDTGVAATVRRYVTGYLLEHENEHVRLTIRYKLRKKKWSWAGSTLTIDGERQQLLAHGYEDYVKIFKEGHRDPFVIEDCPVIEPPDYPLADETEAPAVVRKELIKNRVEGRKHGIRDAEERVTLRLHEGVYIVRCEGPVITLNMPFVQTDSGEWEFAWTSKVVWAIALHEGQTLDVSEAFASLGYDIQRLMNAMGHELPDTDIPRQIRHTSEPKRLNSVEVRRTTVIRV